MSDARPVRRSRRLAVALAVVAALSLAGCNDSDAPKADASSSPAAGDGTDTPSGSATANGSDRAVVTLLEAGVNPQRVLALDVEPGHTESSVLEMTTTTEVDFMSSGPITLPMKLPFTTKVVEVTDTEVTVDVTYGKASVIAGGLQKDMIEQAGKALGYLEGATAHVVYDRSGAVISSDIELGDEAPDLVGRLLDNVGAQSFALAVPFPTEKVGVGARWRADLDLGGAQGTVASTYTLTALTDDTFTVKVVAKQKATPGDSLAGKVVGGSSTSTGTISGRTGFVGPRTATARGKGDATVDVGGQPVKTTFEITLDATTR